MHSQLPTTDIKKLQQCRMFGPRCGKEKQQSKHCFRTKAEVSTWTTESFQPNVLRAHMHSCIWKHDDEAKPTDIDPTMHGWKRDAINKTLEQTLPPANRCVVPGPPDVHVLVPCYLVQYSEGAKVDWIVLMSTLKWRWIHTRRLMLNMEKNLITSIPFQLIDIQHCYYDHYYT